MDKPPYRPLPLLSQLPEKTLAALFARVRTGGVDVAEWSRPAPYDFHLEGCWFERGVLYYHPDRTLADTFIHEAAHALLLANPDSHEGADMRTDEEHTMALQVGLQLRIPGLGLTQALRWMESVGYSFGYRRAKPGDAKEITSAFVWWRTYGETDLEAACRASSRAALALGREVPHGHHS